MKTKQGIKAVLLLLTAVLFLQGCGVGQDIALHQENNQQELTAEQTVTDKKVLDGMAYNRYYIDWAIAQGLGVDTLYGRAFFSEAGNNPRYENNLLVIAEEYGNLSMAAHLLALGADPNKAALQDARPAFAHWKQHLPLLRQAVRFGADIDLTYGDADTTLLTEAITDGDLPLTRFLLEQGATVRASDRTLAKQVAAQEQTADAAIIAALLGETDAASPVVWCALGETETLFAQLPAQSAETEKLLQTAVSFGQVEIAARLLGDYLPAPENQQALLRSAAEQGDVQMVCLLLAKLPALQAADNGVRALHCAIENDQAALVQALLAQDQAGDWIAADQARTTGSLLDTACEYGNPEIVTLIVQAYAAHGPIAQERLCGAATSILSKHNYCDAKAENLRTLLAQGADPNFEVMHDENGAETLFYTALTSQCAELAALMMEYHADTEKLLYHTPPICLAAGGTLPILELFEAADTNARDGEGMTPLMYAVRASDLDAVDWLLAHGADAALTDDSGKRAADYALGACADLLLERLAQ